MSSEFPPHAVAGEAEPWRLAWALAVLALVAMLYAPTVAWLWDRWTMSVWHNAHGLFIPPLSAWFAWQELQRMRGAPRQSSAWGFAFLVPALGLLAVDAALNTQLASAFSLIVLLPGLSLLLLGPARTKAIAFPLMFLVFMLPIPLALTGKVHLFLRHIATAAAATIAPWLGIPVYAESTTLHLANATLEVADACSGFSTLYASVTMAMLTAYFCTSWKRRVILLLAAAPIAIAANIVRVVLLVVMVRWRGLGFLETWQHEATGMLTFALALPLIFWLGSEPASKKVSA
jgi:exosortase